MKENLISISRAAGIIDTSIPTVYKRLKKLNIPILKINNRSFIDESNVKKLLSIQTKNVLEAIQ